MRRAPVFPGSRSFGFTLIELLAVLAIIALLLAIAVPRYFGSLDRSKEAVLKEDLFQMRDAIDKYHGDRNKYPPTLDDLVSDKYLRKIPEDPVTGSSATWIVVAPEDPAQDGVYDVRSGAPGRASDGSAYRDW
ncbi:MAG: type II secretion system protein [Burkholderiales bacterium]